ncbi:MAG: DNA repair protein RadA [bacterium]|nr:DNA repair protein RadA [bacterium]
MKKNTIIFSCSNCGAQSPKWSGRCLECGNWGTYHEEVIDPNEEKNKTPNSKPADMIDLNSINSGDCKRVSTNIDEFDRVLGGGIVPGSLILIGGEPGIGKSTLMLQLAGTIPSSIYISGEESPQQVKSRMERLGISGRTLKFISETNVEKITSAIINAKPALVIVDSIQTVYSNDAPSETGSVAQIRACTVKLLQAAKENNITIIITGHITKDGAIAGPKTLEHLVDTVIYLEQNKNQDYRILRTAKNRFGSTDEVGLFEMTGAGFTEIKNPTGIFLEKAAALEIPGTAICCIMEGTRPFLIEVQALVTKTFFGYPQRKSSGIDLNRLQILIAVLTRRANVNLSNQDIHINVVGGLKTDETALDLAVCAAIISCFINKSIAKNTIILGEVGLGGEIRSVNKLDRRLQEAKKLGFSAALIPDTNTKSDLELIKLKNVIELINFLK